MNTWIEMLPADKVEAWVVKNGEAAKDRYDTTDPHFALWMHYLNRACQRRMHMSFDDLEDWGYRDAYDAGMSPVEACEDMLLDNGYGDAFERGRG